MVFILCLLLIFYTFNLCYKYESNQYVFIGMMDPRRYFLQTSKTNYIHVLTLYPFLLVVTHITRMINLKSLLSQLTDIPFSDGMSHWIYKIQWTSLFVHLMYTKCAIIFVHFSMWIWSYCTGLGIHFLCFKKVHYPNLHPFNVHKICHHDGSFLDVNKMRIFCTLKIINLGVSFLSVANFDEKNALQNEI